MEIKDAILGALRKIAASAEEHRKREKAKEFGRLLREGAFDYPATNDEIETLQG